MSGHNLFNSDCALPSLELRKLWAGIILCFQNIHQLIALDFKSFFILDNNSRTRGHNFKLKLLNFKTTLRQNFFSIRVVPIWNSLPSDIVNSATLKSFKARLKVHDLPHFLKRNFDNIDTV